MKLKPHEIEYLIINGLFITLALITWAVIR